FSTDPFPDGAHCVNEKRWGGSVVRRESLDTFRVRVRFPSAPARRCGVVVRVVRWSGRGFRVQPPRAPVFTDRCPPHFARHAGAAETVASCSTGKFTLFAMKQ